MAKTFSFRAIKTDFQLPKKIIECYTYGYLLAEQRSSDVICFCNPKKKLRFFMSPDEHFESLNTVLILSINDH